MGTTNILDLNNRVSDLEKAVSGGDSAQANKKDIATEFSATTAYTAGYFVYYQGKLYQFNTDHAAGAWDSTDVVEANVTDQIVSNKAAIDGLTALPKIKYFDVNVPVSVSSYVYTNDKPSDFSLPLAAFSVQGGGAQITQISATTIYFQNSMQNQGTIRMLYVAT